jgi:hypothetical protein
MGETDIGQKTKATRFKFAFRMTLSATFSTRTVNTLLLTVETWSLTWHKDEIFIFSSRAF